MNRRENDEKRKAYWTVFTCPGCDLQCRPVCSHSLGETVKAQEDARVHIVDQGETLWEIARPIADERGMDIREVIYELSVNNDINSTDDIRPGQRLVINF